MKSRALLLFMLVWSAGLVMAQAGAEAPAAPSAPTAPATVPAENLSVAIKGTMPGDVPMDLTFTVSGAKLEMRQKLGEVELNGVMHPILGNFVADLSKVGDRYRLSYTLGASIPKISGSTPAVQTVNYRTAAVSGTVMLQPGKPVAVLNDAGKTLMLAVTRVDQ